MHYNYSIEKICVNSFLNKNSGHAELILNVILNSYGPHAARRQGLQAGDAACPHAGGRGHLTGLLADFI